MAFDSKEFFGKIKSGASSAASTVGEMGKAVGKKTGEKVELVKVNSKKHDLEKEIDGLFL